jgi:Mg-chelatase subunit ChlD
VKATAGSKISSLRSPTHPGLTTIAPTKEASGNEWSCELKGSVAEMDRDLVVLVTAEDAHKPALFVERSTSRATTAAMVSLVPNFALKAKPPLSEIVFLIDRSGSMQNTSIQQAKVITLIQSMYAADKVMLTQFLMIN